MILFFLFCLFVCIFTINTYIILEWKAGADEEREKRGDKPPKAKEEKKPKKTKKERENPDFDDIEGYGGNAFHGDSKCSLYTFFGWVLRHTNPVKAIWQLSSFTGGERPQALFQTGAGT